MKSTTSQTKETGSQPKISDNKMKAIVIRSYGDANVLEAQDIPIPKIGPDELLIKIHAAGINPIDWKMRQGYREGFLVNNNPGILGWDVAGTVMEVGDLVTRFKQG